MRHRETYYTDKIKKLLERDNPSWHLLRIEGLSTQNGVPDILGWREGEGTIFGIEVKMTAGKIEPLQKRFLDSLPEAYVAWVAEDDKGATVKLKQWGGCYEFPKEFRIGGWK
jgi:hypothetical protein